MRPIIPAFLLALTASAAQAEPPIVYTRHSLSLDIGDLNLAREADRRVLETRIAAAADQVCGGRPDRGNRYTEAEQARLLPAYDKCRADAMHRVLVSLNLAPAANLALADKPRP